MNAKQMILSKILAVTQSNWMRPALMTLALLVTVPGMTGCDKHH